MEVEDPLPNLPHDVVVDILSRLPVKSLFRFRCTCKLWCSLISDPQFSTKHLNHANNYAAATITTTTNLLRYGVLYFTSFPYISLSLSSMNYEASDRSLVKLDLPLDNSNFHAEILGSCNGLLLVGLGGHALILWNPFIRKYELFWHRYRMASKNNCYTLSGLGFDSTRSEYKVVSVVSDFPPPLFPRLFRTRLRLHRLNINHHDHHRLEVQLSRQYLNGYNFRVAIIGPFIDY
ncbi:F-box/kelch-repeat protein At3g23880-like [Actinidia eriantha]|uniref:F-box/kelch-repeat protein At3g23880-like n=1 Tax=Actinidia eriantha TaxID=165200 RepID=UPI0025835611|nr:F-box/kelch-repeat protein At3g23880-like [Actinidia eriantha]